MPELLKRELKFWDCVSYAFALSVVLGIFVGTAASFVPFALGGIAVVVSTLELCALFAGLGAGSYALRAISSLAFGGIVALGGIVGASLLLLIETGGVGLTDLLVNAVLLAFVYWILAQLPHLLLRFVWNWRLSRFPTHQPFGIQDIFTYTTIVACGFGSLQLARTLFPQNNVLEWSQLLVLLMGAAVVHIVLTLPLTYLLLVRPEERAAKSATVYVILLAVLLFGFLVTVRSSPETAVLMSLTLVAYGCFFGVPVMMLRERGVHLWTRQVRERAELQKEEHQKEEGPEEKPSPESL